jgi:glycosyltransferase involved in cell wall biosynthesis
MSKIIIHLRSAEFFGGPERAILGQCRVIKEFDFVCASFVRGNAPSRFLEEARTVGIETAKIHDSFAGDFRVVGQIKKLMAQKKAAILVCHDYKANFFGRMALKNSSVKQIAHFRGYTTEDRKVRLYNFINAMLLRRMSIVLAVSEKSASLLREMGVLAKAIEVVPNAIEAEKLAPADFKRTINARKPIKAVAAGRLSYEKGCDVLLKAIARIRDDAPAFGVDIYGRGPEEKKLKHMARALNVEKVVSFRGFIDNILPVLRESDFLILPSRSEGMPNILLEAWSQKLGVLSTVVGGVPEMIEHEVSGLLAPPNDPETLAEQLLFALDNPGKMIAYGERGYELVRDRYNYHRQAGILKRIYSETIKD